MLKGNYKKLKVINRVNRKSLKIQISDLIHNSNLGIKVVLVLNNKMCSKVNKNVQNSAK